MVEKSVHLTANFQSVDLPFVDESFETIFAENDYETLSALEEMEQSTEETLEVVHYHSLLEGDDVLVDFNTTAHEAIDLSDIFDELGIEDDEEVRSQLLTLSQENDDTVLHINHPLAADFSVTFLDTPMYTLHVGHHDEIIVT